MLNSSKYYFLISIIYVFFQSSCVSSSPEWIEIHPENNNYWHGIGFASNEIENGRDIARERAIHEISSQIKINVSSELNIVVNDFNGSVENAVTSILNSRVNLLLPELQFVDSYKTNKGIYFYAKLNKDKYRKTMERLRENSITTALNYIKEADKNFSHQSLILVQKAWNEFYPFNDEPVKVIYDGKNINLYSLIKEKLYSFKNRIKIIALTEKQSLRTFIDSGSILSFIVTDGLTQKKLKSIPIKLMVHGKELNLISNENGNAQYVIPEIIYPEMFTVNYYIDIEKLLEEYSISEKRHIDSPIISTFSIEVRRAKALINCIEKNLNKPLENLILEPKVKSFLHENVDFVQSNPDMYILVRANTNKKSDRVDENFPYFIYGNVSITFKNVIKDEQFFNFDISEVKGGDFNSEYTAGIRAYDEMARKIENQFKLGILKN